MARHFRKHWKKYVFGGLVSAFGGSYLARKFRDNNVVRQYCEQAKHYGEQQSGVLDKPKKMTVFLNPWANKADAKIQFMKYAAPLFHLSGWDVTIVESEYEGQIRTLMGYIDPDCDAIVVAGGDGTLMEVVNGLVRRWDVEKTRAIPIGIIPLGKENRFYTRVLSTGSTLSQTRCVCEAAMNVIRGTTVPINMMQLQPESGKTLYALSTIHWGVFRDSLEIKDRFKLFGKFRLLMSHIRTALRGWPCDYSLRLWYPVSSKLTTSDSSSTTPPSSRSHDNHTTQSSSSSYDSSTINNRTVGFLPIANCSSPGGSLNSVQPTALSSGIQGATGWKEQQLDVVGFKLSLEETESIEERLKIVVWSADLSKWDFVKQGWSASLKKPVHSLPGTLSVQSSELILQPCSAAQSWLSIDGEPYEAIPLAVRVLPSVVRVFTRQA